MVIVLIFVSAFFSLAEISLITVRKTRIRQLVEEGNRGALLLERLLQHPTRLMATIQTGVTLILTFSTAIAAMSSVPPLAQGLAASYRMGNSESKTLAL